MTIKGIPFNSLSERVCKESGCKTQLKYRRVVDHDDQFCFKHWVQRRIAAKRERTKHSKRTNRNKAVPH